MEPHTGQLVRRGDLGVELSSFFVDIVATVGLLVVAAVALRLSLRQRRAAAQADASFQPDAALVPGEAVVLGTVEREQGASVAVRVEIEQEGSESENSGIWSYRWTETNRKIHVHPFYLRHGSGGRIRVEPGEDVMLVDEMDGVIKVDLTRRIRVAELLPGAKVFAVGELRRAPDPEAPTAGYRQRSEGTLLVPPRGRRMLLSSEPLGKRFARRAAFHLRWAVLAAVAALGFNALFASFHARRWLGETVEVRVTLVQHYESSDDDDHFEVTMLGPDHLIFSDEVSRRDFSRLHAGDKLQARYVPLWRSATAIGPDATASSGAYLAVPLLGVLALVYGLRARSTRPWYERKKLVEKGDGRLADSDPTAQKAPKRAEGRRRKPSSG
jgi:hypothetical protein